MKNIITISRQFGAGGSTIGRKVADRLGYYYCDKDMIIRAALESGSLSPNEVHYYDERVPTEFGIGQSLFDYYNRPLDERLFKAQAAAIKKVAEKGNCVIVGRNGNIVLQEFDRTLHVFISATDHFRIKRVQQDMPDLSGGPDLRSSKVNNSSQNVIRCGKRAQRTPPASFSFSDMYIIYLLYVMFAIL